MKHYIFYIIYIYIFSLYPYVCRPLLLLFLLILLLLLFFLFLFLFLLLLLLFLILLLFILLLFLLLFLSCCSKRGKSNYTDLIIMLCNQLSAWSVQSCLVCVVHQQDYLQSNAGAYQEYKHNTLASIIFSSFYNLYRRGVVSGEWLLGSVSDCQWV